MTQKQLEKLSRRRLLELLAEQTGKANRLERENNRLKERISDREEHLAQMGGLVRVILQDGQHLDGQQTAQAEALLDEVCSVGEEEEEEEEDSEPPPSQTDMPTREQLLMELQRESSKSRYVWSFKTTMYALITAAAVAVLVAELMLPVLQIYGYSMNPTLYEGDLVVSVKKASMNTGDLIAFYYNNKVLVKRVIAGPGQWVDIKEDGTVLVDDVQIDEPYLTDKALGECNIALPFQVPEGRVFVMGDNRSVSVDSRSKSIGCIAEEQLVGKIVFRIWPLSEFGKLNVR